METERLELSTLCLQSRRAAVAPHPHRNFLGHPRGAQGRTQSPTNRPRSFQSQPQQQNKRNTKRPGLSRRPGRPSHKIVGLWQATIFRQSGMVTIVDRMRYGQRVVQNQAQRGTLHCRCGEGEVLFCDLISASIHVTASLVSENRAFGFSVRLTSLDRVANREVAGRNNFFGKECQGARRPGIRDASPAVLASNEQRVRKREARSL